MKSSCILKLGIAALVVYILLSKKTNNTASTGTAVVAPKILEP